MESSVPPNQSPDELRRLLASIPDALWSAEASPDGDLIYRYFSPGVEHIAGRPPAYFLEAPGRWADIVELPDRPARMAALGRILVGDSAHEDVEYRIRRADGLTRWVRDNIRANPMTDGKIALDGVISDICDRKDMEAALRESEERFRSLAALSSDWYWRQDEQLRFTYLSDEVSGLAGYSAESSIGKARWDLPNIQPLSGSWNEHRAVLEARQTFRDFEYARVDQSGQARYISVSGEPIFDAGGCFRGYQGVARNITERTRAEEALRRLERQLRQAQRLEAMGTLAGGIAHDFNNILGVILGYGEFAVRHSRKGTRLRRDLESIMAAGDRGRALIDRILIFSRSGAGDRGPVHVESVVREVLELLAARRTPGLTIEPRLAAGRATIQAESTQVHQLLMNLMTNAMQAMPTGGVIRVALDVRRFEAEHVATTGRIDPGEYLVLTVADKGVGMTKTVIDRIFDPFFTTKDVGVGTGLGLSLVHGIVSEVGGAIDVESQVDAGSTFSVYLPRLGTAGDDPKAEVPQLPRGNGQRILLVDDEEALVRLTTENLGELGYQVFGFTSSADALGAFSDEPARFDALITDERMPGLGGTALIREVRRLRSDIPIVLATGYIASEGAEPTIRTGANEVLKKPLMLRDLATSLARVLGIAGAAPRRDGEA